ncbi:MAG: hypothetical protein M0009_03590 [Deltaproteobacteria bacterium]|nr:hypothetical protein [Deltaproteobacteria bacterium]
MKRSHWIALFGAAALLFCSAVPVGAFEIGARGLYWFPAFKADMKADDAGVVGDTINAKDTLGLGTKALPTVEVFGGLGKHRVTLGYTPINYSGSTTLSSAVNFGGKTFAAGTNVDTDLKLQMVDLEYQYTFLDMENLLAGFSLGAIGQIKYIDGEAKLNGGGTTADQTARVPLPMLGMGAHIGLLAGILEARAKVTGIGYSGNYIYEALADISYTPFPFLDINAGYKHIGLKIDKSDFYLNTQFTGPYVGLTVSF